MKRLELDVGTMSSACSTLSTVSSTFSSGVKGSSLFEGYNCDNAEVNTLIDKYIKDIKTDIDKLTTKLNNYVNVIKTAIDLLETADKKELSPAIETGLVLPTGFNLLSETPISTDPSGIGSKELDGSTWYSDILSKSYDKYKDIMIGAFPNFVKEGNPQGFAEVGNYLVATNSSGKVYIYDTNTKTTKTVNLGDYHLGGLTHKDGYLYVATGDSTTRYNFDEFVNGNLSSATSFASRTTTNNPSSAAVSFVTSTGSKVITGQFKADNDMYRRGGLASDLIVYDVDKDGNMKENSTIKVPASMTQIQGMCVYNKDGKDYYILTSSYGTNDSKKSTLYVAELGADGKTLVERNSHTLPSGAEQVIVTSDGNLAVAYEGNSSRRNITILDPSKVIN